MIEMFGYKMTLRIRNRIRRYMFNYYPFLVGFLSAITFHLFIIWCNGGRGELRFHHDWPINIIIPTQIFRDKPLDVNGGGLNDPIHHEKHETQIERNTMINSFSTNADNFRYSKCTFIL